MSKSCVNILSKASIVTVSQPRLKFLIEYSLIKKHQAFSQNLLFWYSNTDIIVNSAFCQRFHSIVNRLFIVLKSICKINYLLSLSDYKYIGIDGIYNLILFLCIIFGSRIEKRNSSQISSLILHIYAKIWICEVVYFPTGRLKEAIANITATWIRNYKTISELGTYKKRLLYKICYSF